MSYIHQVILHFYSRYHQQLFLFNVDAMILLNFKNKSPECESLHRFECPCVMGLNHQKNHRKLVKVYENWKITLASIVNREEFNNKNFTVNLQPFIDILEFPLKSDGSTDFSFMSHDCFHLSQKGYALGN